MPTACTPKRCGYHIVMTMVRSQLGGTHPHAPKRDVEKTCALTRIVFLPPRFSQVANHVLTRTENHKHTKHRSMSCKTCSHLGAVATTSKRLKNNGQLGGTHRQARKAEISNTHGQQRWSCTFLTMYANRAKMLAIMAAGPATPMRSQIQQ